MSFSASPSYLLAPDGSATHVRPAGTRWRLREVEALVGGRIALHDVSPLMDDTDLLRGPCKRWTVVAVSPTPDQPLNPRASGLAGCPVFGPAILAPSRTLD